LKVYDYKFTVGAKSSHSRIGSLLLNINLIQLLDFTSRREPFPRSSLFPPPMRPLSLPLDRFIADSIPNDTRNNMTDWLKRPVFARTRTPVPSFSDRQSSVSADDKSEDGDIARVRPTSRVSSYMHICSSTPPISQTLDCFTNIRSPESVYHKPSADHMAETLKVVMMNQSSLDPVPVAYNACILHVLEAYQDLRIELAKKEGSLEELQLSHAKDISDFDDLATEWEMKERDYKVELKKLEVLLSQIEGGMEKVTLARSKSAVHGSAATVAIARGISTIKERNSERSYEGQ
jgi:hypothetical protein